MGLLGPVAGFAYRRRTALLILFVGLFAGAAAYGKGTARKLVGGGFDDTASESARADAALSEDFGLGTPDIAVAYSHDVWRVSDPAFQARLEPTLTRLRAQRGVERVGTPYGVQPSALISKDGHTAVVTLQLAHHGNSAETIYEAIEPDLRAPGLKTLVGGVIPGSREAQLAAESDLLRAELITLPLLALLLVIFFRGPVAASLPLLVGGFAVVMALASIRLLTHVTDISIFAMNIVTFVGLGVAIDYSLFMTSRFRDELSAGMSVPVAIRHTLNTAGRTVGYSGGAVAVSLLGLMVFPLMVLRSIALAGSVVVLMALLGALVFLPAILAMLGPRIDWLSFKRKEASARGPLLWRKVAAFVMRAPVTVTLAVTALLLVLGSPFLRIKAAVSGAAVLPAEAEARQLAELTESDRFAHELASPIQVVWTAPRDVLSAESLPALENYVARVKKIPHVHHVDAAVGGTMTAAQLTAMLASPAGPTLRSRLSPLVKGKNALVRIGLDVPPTSDEAQRALEAVRNTHTVGVSTLATSPAARLVDLKATLASHMPWALAIICLATFVVLFLAFGSVVMPIKAIITNILSLTASFGALVFIFQDGRLEGLLNFTSPGSIELTIPVVMFAVVFGLAMDYELFLLSRVREAYDRTHDTHQSVTTGLEQTGQIITRAALLLVAVMIGFISADMLLVKELGVGMAIAVVVDATIVRALLVPASMQLMGHFNWWAPEPLRRLWLRMHVGVDERSPEELADEPDDEDDRPTQPVVS